MQNAEHVRYTVCWQDLRYFENCKIVVDLSCRRVTHVFDMQNEVSI